MATENTLTNTYFIITFIPTVISLSLKCFHRFILVCAAPYRGGFFIPYYFLILHYDFIQNNRNCYCSVNNTLCSHSVI